MATRSLQETISENIQSKQILSDSTNCYVENSRTSYDPVRAHHHRRRHVPLKRATVRRYKDAIKRQNQLVANQLQIEQRAMYNARQTPLIPLITDIDISVLFKSSQQQNDLFIDILTLLHNIDEECSFFEQFLI